MENTNITKHLEQRGVDLEWNPQDLKRIPRDQPILLICNRMVQGVDELILLELLERVGGGGKLLDTGGTLPDELRDRWLIKKTPSSEQGFSLDWMGDLSRQLKTIDAACPSLALALDFSGNRIREWRRARSLNQILNRLRQLQRPLIPVRLQVQDERAVGNPLSVRLMQRWKPSKLKVVVRIGSPIHPEEQLQFEKPGRFRRFVQSKLFALGTHLEVRRFFTLPRLLQREPTQESIADPIAPDLIRAEIQQLTFGNLIATRGKFDILVAEAQDIPQTLLEIGRLRERTFREVGEGTGKARDLDEFDLYYQQLIIWDREAGQIVGGYRMGKGDQIFDSLGPGGFYISSLFKIGKGFYPIMQQSVELGRSYIVSEYQRQKWPLFLLWKGILFFLLQNPQYRYLYGPMSISKYYSNISKSLIVAYIRRYHFDEELAQYLKPRKPFRAKFDKVDLDVLMESLGGEMKALDNLIEDIEPEHFRIPVLMRQYIKLNARVISFNVDPNFSDVLDGFIILDLQDVPFAMIEALKKEQ
jgi:hypothetical protein